MASAWYDEIDWWGVAAGSTAAAFTGGNPAVWAGTYYAVASENERAADEAARAAAEEAATKAKNREIRRRKVKLGKGQPAKGKGKGSGGKSSGRSSSEGDLAPSSSTPTVTEGPSDVLLYGTGAALLLLLLLPGVP